MTHKPTGPSRMTMMATEVASTELVATMTEPSRMTMFETEADGASAELVATMAGPSRMTMMATEAHGASTEPREPASLRMTMTLDAEPLPMRRARGTELPAIAARPEEEDLA